MFRVHSLEDVTQLQVSLELHLGRKRSIETEQILVEELMVSVEMIYQSGFAMK